MSNDITIKLANILRNFHRNSSHPEASTDDIGAATDAIKSVVTSSGVLMGVDFSSREDRQSSVVCMTTESFGQMQRRQQDLLEANNRYLNRARIAEGTERKARDARQEAQLKWAHATFGGIKNFDPCSVQERARRFLEEAIELVQSLGVTEEEAAHVTSYVYGRPAGDAFQEFGGTALTLGCLGQAAGVSICHAEIVEFDRVQSKTKEHFEARHIAKMEAGL